MLKCIKKFFQNKEEKKPELNHFDGLEAMIVDEYGSVTYNEDYFDMKYPGYVAVKEHYWGIHQDQFRRAMIAAKDFILHVENLNTQCEDESLDTLEGSYARICELFEWYKATQLPENRPFIHINGKVTETGQHKIYFEV